MNEEMYLFPTFLQNYNYTKSANEGKAVDESFSFQDKNGMTISSDVGVSYSFMSDKIDQVYVKFHKGPEEITDVFLRSVIRDSFNRIASTRDIQDIYGTGKASFINDVQTDVQKQAISVGIKVDRILLINELRLPPQILNALNEKTAATQKAMQAENELRVTKAEAAKAVAQAQGKADAKVVEASGEAKANDIVSRSLTPQLIERMRLERWNGAYPQVLGSGTNMMMGLGNVNPMPEPKKVDKK
jgi:regulator of protease activity HflC (stomatin/prohibitin superfamily)